MKRIAIIALIVVAIGAGWWGYQRFFAQPSSPATTDASLSEETDALENVIWASGNLEPKLWAGLSPAAGGVIQQIHVAEGEWVEAGTLLVELQNEVLLSEVAAAEATLAEAEAALAKLRAGATVAALAAAEARLAEAESQVALAASQMIECDAAIAQAEAQVQIANSKYVELASHPTAAELTAAEAEVAIAEAGVSHAQAAYNIVRGDPQIGSRPESLALYQATATLEAANAKLELIRLGATSEQLAIVASEIAAAEAAVEMARANAPGAEAAIQAALANQASAQAALDELLAGASPEEIAIGEARVQSAQATLQVTTARLNQSLIVAPFAGQIGAISVHIGEMATPGQFALLLGDPQKMHVETTDLRETDVVRLQTGMTVEVTFDALPDRIFQGTVTDIAPVSNTEKGSTNYTVHVDVAELDEALRWGMTAFINIQTPR
jgi:HlyD family secretion protein